MLTNFNLGEIVAIDGKVIAIKKSYDAAGHVITTYTVNVPKLGNMDYDEREITRRVQE